MTRPLAPLPPELLRRDGAEGVVVVQGDADQRRPVLLIAPAEQRLDVPHRLVRRVAAEALPGRLTEPLQVVAGDFLRERGAVDNRQQRETCVAVLGELPRLDLARVQPTLLEHEEAVDQLGQRDSAWLRGDRHALPLRLDPAAVLPVRRVRVVPGAEILHPDGSREPLVELAVVVRLQPVQRGGARRLGLWLRLRHGRHGAGENPLE
jgi:hypothetical protein